jgi:hypothetical protein
MAIADLPLGADPPQDQPIVSLQPNREAAAAVEEAGSVQTCCAELLELSRSGVVHSAAVRLVEAGEYLVEAVRELAPGPCASVQVVVQEGPRKEATLGPRGNQAIYETCLRHQIAGGMLEGPEELRQGEPSHRRAPLRFNDLDPIGRPYRREQIDNGMDDDRAPSRGAGPRLDQCALKIDALRPRRQGSNQDLFDLL